VPITFEVWIMKADGSGKKQVTHLNVASFAPFFMPDGKRIIFCTDVSIRSAATRPHHRPEESLTLRSLTSTAPGPRRVTYQRHIRRLPDCSRPDGKKRVFASNRHNAKEGDTNIFIADWVE